MPTQAALLGTYPFTILGNGPKVIELDTLDYSRNKTLTAELQLTSIGTVAGDTLDVELQETRSQNQAYWDTRARFYQVLGNQAASTTAPYADQTNISQDVNLVAPERNERPTGSSGGTDIPPGTVRDGPFAPRLRTLVGLKASHRFRLVTAGAPNTGAWTGQLLVYGHHP